MRLPPVGKEYMCFQKNGKTAQSVRCIKSRIMTKLIDSVISTDTFEQQCVLIKGILKSLCLKYHVQTIGIDPSLRNNALYEHKFLQNIKKYTNILVSVMTINNSKILLWILWFLILKYSLMTVPYIPWHQHQSRNQVLENHCVFSLTY